MHMAFLLLSIIYLSFISLGLPDSLLGSAWPVMFSQLNVPVSYMGIISMLIALGTVISSFFSDKIAGKLGTPIVTLTSVFLTAVSMFMFSVSNSFSMLCFFAIPYGLGAGSIDAALNNYVAIHYKRFHMSWLHCMWGVGASLAPYIMGLSISKGKNWTGGYTCVSIIQFTLTALILISLPVWKINRAKNNQNEENETRNKKSHTIKEIFSTSGAKPSFLTFFFYCTCEQTTGLWAATYLALSKGIDEKTAVFFGTLFYSGIMIGRAVNGFLTFKLSDRQLIISGMSLMLLGTICMCLPFGKTISLWGLIIIGLGCAPIYPSIMHSTPETFGTDKSQAIIGIQTAFAYFGTSVMPALFGLIANHISISLLPVYIFISLAASYLLIKRVWNVTGKGSNKISVSIK